MQTLNTSVLNQSGQALQISGYPSDYIIQVTVSTGGTGTVKVNSASGLTLVAGYQESLTASAASLSFSGTTADLNSALNTLQYRAPNAQTTATLKVSAAVVGVSGASGNYTVYDPVDQVWYQYKPTPANWYEAFRNIRNPCGANVTTYNGNAVVCSNSEISGVQWYRNWNDGAYTTSQYQLNGKNGIFAKIFNSNENAAALAAIKLGGGQGAWVGANNANNGDAYYDANFIRSDRGAYNGSPVGVVGLGNWWRWRDSNSSDGATHGVETCNGVTKDSYSIYIYGIFSSPCRSYTNWASGQPDVQWSNSNQAPTGGAVLIGENYFAGASSGFTAGKWDDVYSHGNQSNFAYDTSRPGFSQAHPFGYLVEYGTADAGNTAGYSSSERTLNITIGGSPQIPVRISNTNLENFETATVQVNASGGSGTIAYQYSVTTIVGSSGVCVISSSGALREANTVSLPLQPATCSVTVTNPANNDYLQAVSEPLIFKFNPINQPDPIYILNSVSRSLSSIGGTVKLEAGGGNGTASGYGTGPGQYSFATQSSTCSISGETLTARSNGPCLVTTTRAPSGIYAVATTQWPTYFYVYQPKSQFPASDTISVLTYDAEGLSPIASMDIKAGQTVTLKTNLTKPGGSQEDKSDLMDFTVYGEGCVYETATAQLSSPNGVSYCTVLAYWDASAPFAYTQSAPELVTFNSTSAAQGLSIDTADGQATAGTGYKIRVYGGNGNTINWTVTGEGCSAPLQTSATANVYLSATKPTTCTIQGRQAPNQIYKYEVSSALTINFEGRQPNDLVITTSTSQSAFDTVTLMTNYLAGGGNGGAITYSTSGTNCGLPTAIDTRTATFRATGIATCVVTALQAPTGIYRYARAQSVILFGSALAPALALTGPDGSTTGDAGSAFFVSASGGNTSLISVNWSFIGAACGSPETANKSVIITSVAAGACTVTASQNESGGYKFVSVTKTFNFNAVVSSNPLQISYSDTPTARQGLSLTINSNGSPTGNGKSAANWKLLASSDSGCALSTLTGSATILTSTNAKTCVVQASQDPYGNYTFKQSAAVAINFRTTRAPTLIVTTQENNSSPLRTETVHLSIASGSNGNPITTYSVSGTGGCKYTQSDNSLTTETGTTPTCTVIASQQPYGAFGFSISEPLNIVFKPVSAPALVLTGSNGDTPANAGSAFTVTVTGGIAGVNTLTFNYAGPACGSPIQSNSGTGKVLTFTPQANGSCTVTASQPAANGYAYVSATKTFNFNSTSANLPSLTIQRTGTPTAGSDYSLTIYDGSPSVPTGNRNPIANWTKLSGNYCSFVDSISSGGTVKVRASQPTTCTFQASQAPFGIYTTAQSQGLTLNFLSATADQIILATNKLPAAGGSVTVSIDSGGNSNPSIQYTVGGTGCTSAPSGTPLGSSVTVSTDGIAYCTVQAKQEAYLAKSYAVSQVRTLYFAAQDYTGPALTITPGATLPSIPFVLTNNATYFANKVSYKVVGAGCSYDTPTATITTPGGVNTYCSVLPFWGYGTPYNPTYFNPVTLSFSLITQETAFTISNATTTATLNTPITVTTRGGSGSGAISFTSVSSKGKLSSDVDGTCSYVNNGNGTATINSAVATTCAVTATKAAASQYKAAVTQTVFFTFYKP